MTDHGRLTRLGSWNVTQSPSLNRALFLFGAPTTRDPRPTVDPEPACWPTTSSNGATTYQDCYCTVRWKSRRVGTVKARFLYSNDRDHERSAGDGVLSWFITHDSSWGNGARPACGRLDTPDHGPRPSCSPSLKGRP